MTPAPALRAGFPAGGVAIREVTACSEGGGGGREVACSAVSQCSFLAVFQLIFGEVPILIITDGEVRESDVAVAIAVVATWRNFKSAQRKTASS